MAHEPIRISWSASTFPSSLNCARRTPTSEDNHVSLCTSIVLLLTVMPAADSAGKIAVHGHAPSSIPLQMACDRLATYLQDCPEAGEIRTVLQTTSDPALGDEGYAIRSEGRLITIEANTDAGAANGVYTLLRTLMIEDLPSPWQRSWDLRRSRPSVGAA